MADYEVKQGVSGPLIDWVGGQHGLGCLPRAVSAYADQYPPVSAVVPTVPPSQWTEQDFEPFSQPAYDQAQTSACGGHAEVAAMDIAFALAEDERPRLSAAFAYGLVNGGRDQGSAIPDLLHAAETVGVCLEKTVPPGRIFGPYPAAAMTEAKRFRIEAAYDCKTWADAMVSIERNLPVVTGIDIGGAFEPDANGVLPDFRPSPEGVLGHAVCLAGKRKIGNRWYAKLLNSWSRRWGVNGWAWCPETYWNRYFGAWSIRALKSDPNDPTPAPVAG